MDHYLRLTHRNKSDTEERIELEGDKAELEILIEEKLEDKESLKVAWAARWFEWHKDNKKEKKDENSRHRK